MVCFGERRRFIELYFIKLDIYISLRKFITNQKYTRVSNL